MSSEAPQYDLYACSERGSLLRCLLRRHGVIFLSLYVSGLTGVMIGTADNGGQSS